MKLSFKHFLTRLFTYKLRSKDILLVFVGDLVMETLENKYKYWRKKCDLMYLHTDNNQAQLYSKYSDVKMLYIGDVGVENHCGRREFEDGVNYFQAGKELVFKEIKTPKKTVIVSSLRYSSACGISAGLFADLCRKNLNVSFIGIKPFGFEGKCAANNYSKATELMNQAGCNNVAIIDPNNQKAEIKIMFYIKNKLIELVEKEIG